MSIVVGLLLGVALLVAARRLGTAWRIHRALGTRAREHDMERVASYATLRQRIEPVSTLPEAAWTDLDMDAVFRALDRTESWPGRQLLYDRLRREDHTPSSVAMLDAAATRIAGDAALHARTGDALRRLDDERVGLVPLLFLAPLPPRIPYAAVFPVLTALSLGALGMSLAMPRWLPALLAVTAINLFVRLALRKHVADVAAAMSGLVPVVRAARRLSALAVPELADATAALARGANALSGVERAARWLSFAPDLSNELVASAYEYVNLVLLLDLNAFDRAMRRLRADGDTLRATYDALGWLDVARALGDVRSDATRWCRPVDTPDAMRVLDVEDVVHPLLTNAVPNTLHTAGRSALVTGSNMAGKSTFIRTLGVNAVLARTIATAFATRWSAPRLRVRTMIGRGDSLVAGRSYYLAEVEAVRALLDTRGGEPCLFLVDELFRGTNTVDRVAAGAAVLRALDDADDLCVVATHDLELLALAPRFTPYHFRERIDGDTLTFDYRLHPGPSTTRDALAILRLVGYPSSIVDDALATAAWLERRHASTS